MEELIELRKQLTEAEMVVNTISQYNTYGISAKDRVELDLRSFAARDNLDRLNRAYMVAVRKFQDTYLNWRRYK